MSNKMKRKYYTPYVSVVDVEQANIICSSNTQQTTSQSKQASQQKQINKTESVKESPAISSTSPDDLKGEEKVAYNIVKAHQEGNDSSFNHFSRILQEDAAMNHDAFWGCKNYYILSQGLFYTLTRNFNPQSESRLQSIVFFFTHFYLLKAKREMEKGNTNFDNVKYITICKQLCYVSSEYKSLIFERVNGMLPNGSMETYVHQIMGLAYVNYLSIQDKGKNIVSDSFTEKYYKNFVSNNQALINGNLSPDRKNAFYNHVHGNEDTLLQTYEIEVIS